MRIVCALILLVGGAAATAQTPKEEKLAPPTANELKTSENNLKQIGLALHNYESAMQVFPNNSNPQGKKPAVSWRVAILPFIEQENLFKAYKFDEEWDGENNKKLIEKMPTTYAPVRVKTKEKGHTFYRGFTGKGTLFEEGKPFSLAKITDGTSNTIAVVEAGESVPWTKPDDIPFDAKKDLPKLGGLFDGEFHIALCDGSVRKVKAKFDADILKAMITRNGGEVVDVKKLDK